MPAGTEIGDRDLPEAAIDGRRCNGCENGGGKELLCARTNFVWTTSEPRIESRLL